MRPIFVDLLARQLDHCATQSARSSGHAATHAGRLHHRADRRGKVGYRPRKDRFRGAAVPAAGR